MGAPGQARVSFHAELGSGGDFLRQGNTDLSEHVLHSFAGWRVTRQGPFDGEVVAVGPMPRVLEDVVDELLHVLVAIFGANRVVPNSPLRGPVMW